jgi:hypothetical protein
MNPNSALLLNDELGKQMAEYLVRSPSFVMNEDIRSWMTNDII